MKKLLQIARKEGIHRNMVTAYLIMFFLTLLGILSGQYKWSADDRAFYYAHGGVQYDFWCLVLVPALFAIVWGLVEMAWYLSSPTGSGQTKRGE
ncbi:hypothetical protein KGQ72_00975 [Patescibacteria group bacterium]|nr:hypothetical protein [Patescibacteria group bacterium]